MTTDSWLPSSDTQLPQVQPQQNFLSSLGNGIAEFGKDAFNTLIGTPATRLGQVGGNVIGRSLGLSQDQLNKAGQQSQDLPFGLGTVAPQQGGLTGVEQLGGQAAKSAAYLVGGEGAGALEGGIGSKILEGATTGAKAGLLGGTGEAMSQGGTPGDIASSGAEGGLFGGISGGVIGGATGAVKNIWDWKNGEGIGGNSSYESNLAKATTGNLKAGDEAAGAIHEASNTMADVKTGLSNQFAQAPAIIAKVDPGAGVTLPKDVVEQLHTLKDTKAWALPDYIRNPEIPSDLKNIGSGEIRLDPFKAQDLATQLNDLKFNSKGDVVINQQASNLVDKVKALNQAGLGHVTDNLGNSVWSRAYQDFRQGSDAMDAMSSLIPNKRAPGEMLDPTEVDSSANKMMKMMETPQGTASLMRANEQFKNITGYDLLNDPMGSIQKLIDSNQEVKTAIQGNYMKQVGRAFTSPNAVGRRLLYITGSILSITALATAFRKQIGNALNNNGAEQVLHSALHLP